MRKRQVWIASLLAAAALCTGTPSMADVVPFTWDPSHAAPALTSGLAAFTADGISVTNYLRATNVNDLTTLQQSFSGAQIQTINGFTLGGAPVSAPGLNSAYGLYFRVNLAGTFAINSSGAIVGPSIYSLLDVQLVADVGHDDGTASVDAAGIGFSNAAGVANDVVLATGSLISASVALGPTGTRNAHYLTTFQPVASEAGFFVGPGAPLNWEDFLNTPPSAFVAIPVNSLTVLQVVGGDGSSTGTAQLVSVPEPASIGLLAVGLLGLGYAGRRRSWRA